MGQSSTKPPFSQHRLRSGAILRPLTTNGNIQQSQVLVDASIYEDYTSIYEDYKNLKKDLEGESKISRFMESSGNPWTKKCDRLERETNQVLVALECAQKKNTSSFAPLISASKNFVLNMVNTNSASWFLWKDKHCDQLRNQSGEQRNAC